MNDDVMNRLTVEAGHCLTGVLTINRSARWHLPMIRNGSRKVRAPLSHSIPKRADPYDDASCKAVFGGLLPEEDQRAAVARALGISCEKCLSAARTLGWRLY